MPAKTTSYSVEALKGQAVMKQLRETVTDIQTSIGHRIFDIAATYVLLF
jgi:glycogen(starch) synthase